MSEFRRIILYFALAIVGFLLWSAWQEDLSKESTQLESSAAQVVKQNNPIPVPAQPDPSSVMPAENTQEAGQIPLGEAKKKVVPNDRMISVKTDVFDILIDKKGGNISSLSLSDYPVSLNSKEDVVLFTPYGKNYSIDQSGLLGERGPDTQNGMIKQGMYQAEKAEYKLSEGKDRLEVNLYWKNEEGLQVEKTYTFKRGHYDIGVSYEVQNKTDKKWGGNFYAQLKQKEKETKGGMLEFNTFTGASVSTSDDHYKKISYKKMNKKNLDETTKGGWLAFQQRYFLTSWVPEEDKKNRYYSRVDSASDIYTLGVVGPQIQVAPGEKKQINATLYAGPEVAKNLKSLAPYLDMTVDYGWLWFIAKPIFWVMDKIHSVVGNWGVSIILVTLLIKLAFFHLSATSYRSMARMQKLTPLIKRLREQYKDDKQKLSQETMALYRREKVNPLGGCLPMIVQIPFFFALYYVLIESVELRQAPFVFWIQDLAVKDPYYVLPILMGLSMLVQQKLTPSQADPMQAKIMMFMPIIFTVFFLNFPAGLVLYWLTNNCLSIVQQWWIMRSVNKPAAK